jgi:pyruvate dehydrogenase E1 component alpha subunit
MRADTFHEAIARAAERARAGEGPTLIEALTYRYKGHSMSDPQKYRSKEEVDEYKDKDPILHALSVLQANKWITDAELDAIDEAVKAEVDASVEFAENSPYPDASALWEYVYSEPNYPFIQTH